MITLEGPGPLPQKYMELRVHRMVWNLLKRVAAVVLTQLAKNRGAQVDFTAISANETVLDGDEAALALRSAIEQGSKVMAATARLRSPAGKIYLEEHSHIASVLLRLALLSKENTVQE